MSIKRKDIWVFQFSTGCHSTTFRGKVPFRLRSTGSLHVATPSEDWGLSGEGRFDIPHIDTHTHTHKFPSFLPASRRSLPLWSERWKDDKSANSPSHTTSLDFLGKSKSRKILRHLIHDMNKLYFRQSSSGDGARSQNPTRKHVTNVTTWNFPHGSSQKENLKSCGVSFLCKERNFSASECLAVRYFFSKSAAEFQLLHWTLHFTCLPTNWFSSNECLVANFNQLVWRVLWVALGGNWIGLFVGLVEVEFLIIIFDLLCARTLWKFSISFSVLTLNCITMVLLVAFCLFYEKLHIS